MGSGRLLIIVFLVIIPTCGYGEVQLTSDQEKALELTIAGLDTVAGILAALGAAPGPLGMAFQIAASVLGIVSPVMSIFMQFTYTESEELQLMKTKFFEVNGKLETIMSQLGHIENLITYENQRAVYIADANRITFAHKQLLKMFDEMETANCTTSTDCQRQRTRVAARYLPDFNVKSSLSSILTGTIQPTHVFADGLLNLIQKTYTCDVGEIKQFSQGVFYLALKAQQVILVHEKLTRRTTSSIASIHDWLEHVYKLQEHANLVINHCHKHIKTYMIGDIRNEKFQTGTQSNADAVAKVKKLLDTKYSWINWIVYSYKAHGSDKHSIDLKAGKFWSMPDTKERIRNIIAAPVDKHGRFMDQKWIVYNAVEKMMDPYKWWKDASAVFENLKRDLEKHGIWRNILSMSVLKKTEIKNFHMETGNDTSGQFIRKSFGDFRIVIVLRSEEQIKHFGCRLKCKNKGTCKLLPLTSMYYCQCEKFYEGETCEHHIKTQLAVAIDSMIGTTLRVPQLTDVYFDLQDLKTLTEIGLSNINSTLHSTLNTVLTAFRNATDHLDKKLAHQFKWTNLITHYSSDMKNLEYYSFQFKSLAMYDADLQAKLRLKLATRILEIDGIQKWLYEYNFIIKGRSDTHLTKHDALLFLYMDKHAAQACSAEYKVALDNVWQQLLLRQQVYYLIWAQAKDSVGESPTIVNKLYQKRLQEQLDFMENKTCSLDIPHSTNMHCVSNTSFYLHPRMSLKTKCEHGYYLSNALTIDNKCNIRASGCVPCNCHPAGSRYSHCHQANGTCHCKANFQGVKCDRCATKFNGTECDQCTGDFYGRSCNNRDCQWGKWGTWSSCGRRCGYGYGGTQRRYKGYAVRKSGSGKTCKGLKYEYKSCFNKCCSYQFHCSKKKTCIFSSRECNYRNDCGDNEDENHCEETCQTQYTNFRSQGNAVELKHHYVECEGSSRNVIQMFKMQNSLSRMLRYQYACCKLYYNAVQFFAKSHSTSYSSGDSVSHLTSHVVDCARKKGFIHGFRLLAHYAWWKPYMKYSYSCSIVDENRQDHFHCYNGYTSYEGDGLSNYMRHHYIKCNAKYFLSYFKLERKSSGYRYRYKCCQIRP